MLLLSIFCSLMLSLSSEIEYEIRRFEQNCKEGGFIVKDKTVLAADGIICEKPHFSFVTVLDSVTPHPH